MESLRKSRIPRLLTRPVGRGVFSITATFLLYFLVKREPIGGFSQSLNHAFRFTMISIFAVLWIFAIIGRILELHLSRLWAAPYVLVLTVMAVVVTKGSSIEIGVGAVTASVLQLPLMLLPPRAGLSAPRTE